MGLALSAPALVEQYDLECLGVEAFVGAPGPPRSRATVDHQRWPAFRVAPGLPVDAVAVTNIELPVVVDLRLGK